MLKSKAGLLLAAALAVGASTPFGAALIPNDRNLTRRTADKRIKRAADQEALAKAEAKRQRKLDKRAREAA